MTVWLYAGSKSISGAFRATMGPGESLAGGWAKRAPVRALRVLGALEMVANQAQGHLPF